MRLLVDTHVLLWWFADSPRLGERTRHSLASASTEIYVSAVSVCEIAIKQAQGKLKVPGEFTAHVPGDEFTELPFTIRHGLALANLPLHHRDPFDRMLIVQAQLDDFTIVTADRAFAVYDVPILPAGF